MKNRYVVFDVETPNSENSRMSSIGVCVVENLQVTDSFYSLVNPETHYDDFNIFLTGITPESTADEKNFGELWNSGLGNIMQSGIVIAHNAPFDMGVLAKCIRHYGVDCKEYIKYACTVRMSKKSLPQLVNHKLNTVSDYLGVRLSHHNAESDAYAAAQILIYCLKNGCNISDFIKTYRI